MVCRLWCILLYFRFESRSEVYSFYFYTAYANMSRWEDRVERVSQIRNIFTKYPEFNATLWEFESSLYDFTMVAKNIIYRSIIVTMICMAVISIFFIPSLSCILIAAFSVGSICVGKFQIKSIFIWYSNYIMYMYDADVEVPYSPTVYCM